MDQSIVIPLTKPAKDFHRAFDVGLSHERKRLGYTHPLYINGRPCRSSTKPFLDTSPADTRVLLGRFQQAKSDHIDKAVKAARKAYPFWRELGWEQRVSFVRKVGELLVKHQYEVAALLCLEAGKSRAQAMAETQQTSELIDYYCQQMEGQKGYRLTTSINGSERSYDTMEPYGVWAILAPSDLPLTASASMIIGAILAGNTVVYKPSSLTPFTGLRFYDLFSQAGFPIGIVNYLTGPGQETGQALASHDGIDGLSFAGSRASGLSIHQRYSRNFPKPCVMEMGGNNPVIVMPSANLCDATEGIFQSAFSSCGQTSSSCSRVYVHQQVSQDLLEQLVDRVQNCKVGFPDEPDTFMGPLISAEALARFQQAVRIGKKDGRLLCGGRVLSKSPYAHGHFVEPTIFDQVRKDSRLFMEEFLVPVLAVSEIRSLNEALKLANTSSFGLSAGIFSQVEAEQEEFFDGIEAGVALCNRRHGATSGIRPGIQSFGGWKTSGSTGKNMFGPYYITQFMREQTRTVCW